MKIIILGAGQVGGTLAEHLANEQNDITVVDTNADKLRTLRDRSGLTVPNVLHADDTLLLMTYLPSDGVMTEAARSPRVSVRAG